MYLVSNIKAKIKHLWKGKDTFCRQYSTGGLNPSNYTVVVSEAVPAKNFPKRVEVENL